MGVEEKLPSGILLTTVEKVAGYARKSSVWPATFGLACCAIELMQTGGPRHDLARFGMERASSTPRQADLMIVAGRVSQKMAPVLRQIYDQMADPKWVISMGVCASSGGMFNNYAIVQGVDHVVPVDIYLPGCPPRPEMLLDAIVKLHDKIMNMKLGVNREREVTELEEARLRRLPLAPELAGSQSRTAAASGPTLLGTPALPSPAVRSRNLGMTSAAGPQPAAHPGTQPASAQPASAQAAEARAAEARAAEAGAAGE
jgi:NADH-quinone oxidoreductase subunit B